MANSILEESKKAKKGIFGIILKKRNIVIGLAVLIIAGASYYYFFQKDSSSQAATPQPKQWTVTKEDLKISVSATGKVVAKDGVELSFPVAGNLEVDNVYTKEGDKIKKGDKIASVKTETLAFELRSAYASYQSALSNLSTKQAGATESDITKAKIAIDQAQVSLDQAKISLEKTKTSASQSVINAESTLATAENNLKINTSIDDSEIVRNAYSDLASAVKSIDVTLQRVLRDSDAILGVDDTAINDAFESVLGAKNQTSLNAAKNSYAQARLLKNNLDSALVGLDGSTAAAVDGAAQKASSALVKFQDHLYDMQTMLDATITFVDLSQSELDAFKATISANRSSINSGISTLNNSIQAIADAKSSLNQYQIVYNKAVNDLAVTKSQTKQDVDNSTISVRSREIALTSAKNDYADLIAPVKESDLAAARAQLTSAAISVDRAKYNMEQATLVSPIDGVVAALNYKQGDIILDSSTSKTVATIINNDTLFIEANIEEADVSKLKVGDKAQVTFDAIDGANLSGEISFISLTSLTSSNGIVTYLVRVIISNTGASKIREGMTASIDFVTSEALGVLTAPVAAVRNVGGNPSVEMTDGKFTTVVTGFTDGKKVEIISGLKAGDVILY